MGTEKFDPEYFFEKKTSIKCSNSKAKFKNIFMEKIPRYFKFRRTNKILSEQVFRQMELVKKFTIKNKNLTIKERRQQ